MEENLTADKHPRRLVVGFELLVPMRPKVFGDQSVKASDLINTYNGDRPQLVHYQDEIERPSRLVRFATRLGLAKGDKPVLEAVEKAYKFIARNYALGDQVILCVFTNEKWETNPHAKAAEVLARHMHDGTSPAQLADTHPGNRRNMIGSRIPIYGVVVWDRNEIQSMCTWSDWLKSRLPPGIRNIVCYRYSGGFRSCSTTYDPDGGMISRELRFSSDHRGWELDRDATKHLLYYEQWVLPEWDKYQPVWTRVLNPTSHQSQDTPASELTKPAGMHYHEVQRYQDLPGVEGDGSMLVWKSCRKAPKAPN